MIVYECEYTTLATNRRCVVHNSEKWKCRCYACCKHAQRNLCNLFVVATQYHFSFHFFFFHLLHFIPKKKISLLLSLFINFIWFSFSFIYCYILLDSHPFFSLKSNSKSDCTLLRNSSKITYTLVFLVVFPFIIDSSAIIPNANEYFWEKKTIKLNQSLSLVYLILLLSRVSIHQLYFTT